MGISLWSHIPERAGTMSDLFGRLAPRLCLLHEASCCRAQGGHGLCRKRPGGPELREEERRREEEGCRKKEEERKKVEEVEKEEKMENESSAKSGNTEDVGTSNRTTTTNDIRSILDSDSDSD